MQYGTRSSTPVETTLFLPILVAPPAQSAPTRLLQGALLARAALKATAPLAVMLPATTRWPAALLVVLGLIL